MYLCNQNGTFAPSRRGWATTGWLHLCSMYVYHGMVCSTDVTDQKRTLPTTEAVLQPGSTCPPVPAAKATSCHSGSSVGVWQMGVCWIGWWLKNTSEKYKSQLGLLWIAIPNGKIKNDPNHQPVKVQLLQMFWGRTPFFGRKIREHALQSAYNIPSIPTFVKFREACLSELPHHPKNHWKISGRVGGWIYQ